MEYVLSAPAAMPFELQPVFDLLFVLVRKVIDAMAIRTLHFDEIFL